MLRERVEHVREEWKRSVDRTYARAIDTEVDPDLGLLRVAVDGRGAHQVSLYQVGRDRTNTGMLRHPLVITNLVIALSAIAACGSDSKPKPKKPDVVKDDTPPPKVETEEDREKKRI